MMNNKQMNECIQKKLQIIILFKMFVFLSYRGVSKPNELLITF